MARAGRAFAAPGPVGTALHAQLRGQGCHASSRSHLLPPCLGGGAFLLERAGAGERGCVQFAGHWGWTLPHLCVQVEARAWGEPALFEKG